MEKSAARVRPDELHFIRIWLFFIDFLHVYHYICYVMCCPFDQLLYTIQIGCSLSVDGAV